MLSRMSIDSTRFGKLLDNATIQGDFLRSSELTYFAKFIFEPYGRGQNETETVSGTCTVSLTENGVKGCEVESSGSLFLLCVSRATLSQWLEQLCCPRGSSWGHQRNHVYRRSELAIQPTRPDMEYR